MNLKEVKLDMQYTNLMYALTVNDYEAAENQG